MALHLKDYAFVTQVFWINSGLLSLFQPFYEMKCIEPMPVANSGTRQS